MTKLVALETAARGATPGPWFVDEDTRPGMSWNRSIDTDEGHGHTVCFMTHSDGKFPERDKATADFIALANPSTVLALCEVARKAKALDDELRLVEFPRGLFAELRAALASLDLDGGVRT